MNRETAAADERRLAYPGVWQAIGWIGLATVVATSVLTRPPQLPSFLGWDKAQHLLAYALLMWWFRQAFADGTRWVLGLLALGVVLEFVQALTPARTFDYADMVANLLGVGIGIALTMTLLGRTLAWCDALAERGLRSRRDGRGG